MGIYLIFGVFAVCALYEILYEVVGYWEEKSKNKKKN